MHHMPSSPMSHRIARAALLACAAIFSLGCDPLPVETVDEAESETPFITGRITNTGHAWGYLVEGEPGPGQREDRAYFRLASADGLRWRSGARATPADLAVGRRVTVWITGPVLESYPAQVAARAVVLEP